MTTASKLQACIFTDLTTYTLVDEQSMQRLILENLGGVVQGGARNYLGEVLGGV